MLTVKLTLLKVREGVFVGGFSIKTPNLSGASLRVI